jgi:hypothetical protein
MWAIHRVDFVGSHRFKLPETERFEIMTLQVQILSARASKLAKGNPRIGLAGDEWTVVNPLEKDCSALRFRPMGAASGIHLTVCPAGMSEGSTLDHP